MMIKKITGLTLGALISATSFASTTSMSYDFIANEPQELLNVMFWEVTGHCHITKSTSTTTTKIHYEILDREGSINGVHKNKGDVGDIEATINQKFDLSAQPGARVSLSTNHDASVSCEEGSY